MWKIDLSKQADKFIEKENVKDDEIISLVQKFINYRGLATGKSKNP